MKKGIFEGSSRENQRNQSKDKQLWEVENGDSSEIQNLFGEDSKSMNTEDECKSSEIMVFKKRVFPLNFQPDSDGRLQFKDFSVMLI